MLNYSNDLEPIKTECPNCEEKLHFFNYFEEETLEETNYDIIITCPHCGYTWFN